MAAAFRSDWGSKSHGWGARTEESVEIPHIGNFSRCAMCLPSHGLATPLLNSKHSGFYRKEHRDVQCLLGFWSQEHPFKGRTETPYPRNGEL